MAALWYAVPGAEYPAPWPALPEWKLRELLRRRSGAQRALSLLGYAMLADLTGADLTALERGTYGKPRLPGGPEFSLAHTRGLVVCALAPHPVGVDVERLDAPKAVEAWTARESFGKYLGVGAQAPPPGLPVWTGRLPGGFWACVCTGRRNEAVTVTKWEREQK